MKQSYQLRDAADLARREAEATLHALEERIPENQNLKGAEARLSAARAMVRLNRAALFPTISTSVGASSVRESANQPFLSPNAKLGSSGDFLLSLDMSYESSWALAHPRHMKMG